MLFLSLISILFCMFLKRVCINNKHSAFLFPSFLLRIFLCFSQIGLCEPDQLTGCLEEKNKVCSKTSNNPKLFHYMIWSYLISVCKSQLLNFQEFCYMVVKYSNY